MTSSTTIKVGGVVFTGEKSVELHLNDCSAPQLREVYEDLGGDSGSSFKLPQHRSELVRMIIKLMVSQDLLEYIPSEVHHVLRSEKRTRTNFNPQHWLLCHVGLYQFEPEF